MSVAAFGAGRLAGLSLSSGSRGFVVGSPFYGRLQCPIGRRTLASSGRPSPPKFEKVLRVTPKQKETGQSMLSNFLGPKPMPEKNTAAWYGEMLLICTVFAITGSSTMVLVSKGFPVSIDLKYH